MGTTKIKTDATFAYIKAMGNRQGPHMLATEFVGTSLAAWFGLSIADFALLTLQQEACFELPRGNRTQPGSAFVSHHVEGRTWGGSETELQNLENPFEITRLVVFDTWLRNCDRYPPDLNTRKPNYANVYLADTDRPGRSRLLAIDHTHCFNCGRDLNTKLADIDLVRDRRIYGLFPAFVQFLGRSELVWCGSMLRSLNQEIVRGIVEDIPREWDVSTDARSALTQQICDRSVFVADMIDTGWPFTQSTNQL
jgi:hypothetical protein